MMSVALLALLGWIWTASDQEPAALVQQLGSVRYAEREAAGSALRALGREALDALRPARTSADPEIRSRSTELVEEIEAALLIQPTLIQLNYRDRTIAEVAGDLTQQSGSLISLQPDASPGWTERRITLVRADRVPLWEAIHDLCRAGQLRVTPVNAMMGPQVPGQRPLAAELAPAQGPAGPAIVSGPFRVVVTSLEFHKGRSFLHPNVAITLPGQPAARPAGANPVAGLVSESFLIGLQVQAEPRMTLAQEGPVKLLEAVDDLGQSLLLPGGPQSPAVPNGFQGLANAGSSLIAAQLPLAMPKRPGTVIQRLKGTMPVAVIARKPDPLIVPLAEKDKTIENASIAITVHGVKQEPGQGFSLIDLTVKNKGEAEPSARVGFGPEFMLFRHNPGNPQSQVELVNQEGRPLQNWFAIQPQPGNDGMRMTVRVMNNENLGPPTAIRYYDLSRATTDVTFELRDIPMP